MTLYALAIAARDEQGRVFVNAAAVLAADEAEATRAGRLLALESWPVAEWGYHTVNLCEVPPAMVAKANS